MTIALESPTVNQPLITLSPCGTARITFADGTGITLVRQASQAQALRTALAMKAAMQMHHAEGDIDVLP